MQNRHHKTLTSKRVLQNKTHHDKQSRAEDGGSTSQPSRIRKKSPVSARMGFLFGLLLLIFVQYLTFFDGQEKINQGLPEIVNLLVNQIAAIRTD